MNECSFIFAVKMRIRDKNKETAIRQKAMQMIVRDGLDRFSMQKLAREAKVSPATLYIYYADKDDLILSLCAEAGSEMTQQAFIGFDTSMSFSEGLKVQWLNRAKYSLQHPEQVLFLEEIRHSYLKDRFAKLIHPSFSVIMSEWVQNALKKNQVVKVPIEVYWSIAFAPLYNLVKFHFQGESVGGYKFTFSEEVMMTTFHLVLRALTPE